MAMASNKRSVMMLYAEQNDPVGHAVRIVLAEKDVNVEIHYVDPNHYPEDLHELNPYHTVLTLIDRDLVLYDAQIMMEYLDERFPHPPLMPVDPVARAMNRQFRYRVMRDLYQGLNALEEASESAKNIPRKVLRDNLAAIAPTFSQYQFFMSNDYSLVDCLMAPLLWRLALYGVKLPNQAKLVMKYAERLFCRDAFKLSLSELEKGVPSIFD
jgi:RNA polymerase-associated protein